MTLADPRVLKILTEAVRKGAVLNARTRHEVLLALGRVQRHDTLAEVLARHRQAFARVLTSTRLAAVLSGMASVLPQLPQPKPAATTPALPEMEATALAMLPLAQSLPLAARDDFLAAVLPEQAEVLRQALAPLPGPTGVIWEPAVPDEPKEMAKELRFPIIDEAAKELQSRQVLTRLEYEVLVGEARVRAFTVAGIEERSTLEKINKALAESVAEGPTVPLFRQKVAAVLDGTMLSDGKLEGIFRDGVQSAYSRGLDAVLAHPLVGSYFPYEERMPIRDSRLSELCRVCSESGIAGSAIWRTDDPVLNYIKPPSHRL